MTRKKRNESFPRRRVKPAACEADKKPAPLSHEPGPEKGDYAGIHRAVTDYQRDHAAEMEKNPRKVREELVKQVHSRFPLKRGPRTNPKVLEAYRLQQSGLRGKELFCALFSAYAHLDEYGQHLLQKGIYAALRRYKDSLRHVGSDKSDKF